MENKPIAWVVFDSLGDEDDFFFEEPNDLPEGYTYAPLYTAPPQREWQGLTDEEIRRTNHHRVDGAYDYSFKQGAQWADATLRGKNFKP